MFLTPPPELTQRFNLKIIDDFGLEFLVQDLLISSLTMNAYTQTFQSYRIQKTLSREVHVQGIGLHTGAPSSLRIKSAPPNHGVWFVRTDLPAAKPLPAHYRSIVSTSFATTLGDGTAENQVSTVEHILSALYALGISNAIVEVDGPEIPILDGSAAPFLELIWKSGITLQPFTAPAIRVLKPIKVFEKGAICELLPRDHLRLTVSVDFPHPKIGLQTFALEVTPQSFQQEVARARTFGFLHDVEKLKQMKLARGASLENVLAFTDEGVMNQEGMRFADECARHKTLDALGDLSLIGAIIQGEMVSYRGGHSIHFALLRELDKFPTHWKKIAAEPFSMPQTDLDTASAGLRDFPLGEIQPRPMPGLSDFLSDT